MLATLLGWWTWLRSLWAAPGTLLLLGLDNAGKTSLQDRVCGRPLRQHTPTQHPTRDDGRVGSTPFHVVDVGGHEEARAAWADYFVRVSGIVFVVDAHDVARMAEACGQLQGVLDAVPDAPLLLLLNKADLTGPSLADERKLELARWLEQAAGPRRWNVCTASVTQDRGWAEALAWLAANLH